MTAPRSLGLSANLLGFRVSSSEVPRDARRECTPSTSSRDKDNTLHQNRRETSANISQEAWAQIDKALGTWLTAAEKNTKDSIQQRQEINQQREEIEQHMERQRKAMNDLESRITNTYHCISDVKDALKHICQIYDQVNAQNRGQTMSPLSSHAQATRAIYADWGSNEGTLDYENCRRAQVCLSVP